MFIRASKPGTFESFMGLVFLLADTIGATDGDEGRKNISLNHERIKSLLAKSPENLQVIDLKIIETVEQFEALVVQLLGGCLESQFSEIIWVSSGILQNINTFWLFILYDCRSS